MRLFWGTGVNKGISGQTLDQIAGRFQTDVVALHPSAVHILAGTNDLYPNWELCGTVGIPDARANIEATVNMPKVSNTRTGRRS